MEFIRDHSNKIVVKRRWYLTEKFRLSAVEKKKCKHTISFSILKGAICEKASESIFFLFFFCKQKRCYGFGKREQTSFTQVTVR